MIKQYSCPKTGFVRKAMTDAIKPMLAMLNGLPRDQERYGFEYKWDGVRAIYFWNGIRSFLQSRNMLDITDTYPEIKPMGSAIGSAPVIFDGEIIAIDKDGRPSFNLLQNRFGLADPAEAVRRSKTIPIAYMIFDILYFDQYSLLNVPYDQRRELLESFDLAGPAWQVPPWNIGNGSAMLEAANNMHLEGILAKRLDSPYEPDKRTGAWIKIKLVNRQEFVIGGWTPFKHSDRSRIGALLVGYYKGDKFIFAGAVGTGFTDTDRKKLRDMLNKYKRPSNPFDNTPPRADAVYVQPKFVAEIEYRGWTDHEILRQPSFKGLRDDKDPMEVVREDI